MNKGGTALLTPFADESRQRASLVSGEFKEDKMSKELAKTYDPNGIEDTGIVLRAGIPLCPQDEIGRA